MKKLKELTYEELVKLHQNNKEFAEVVYEEAYDNNMFCQEEDAKCLGTSVFDYHDHYSSFYLTTPMHYGVKDGHSVAHKLDQDYMNEDTIKIYDELNKLADEYDNMEADELEEKQEEYEDKMNDACDRLAEEITKDLRGYEVVSDDDIFNVLDRIYGECSFLSDWETDGTIVYEHITKEYK